MNPSPTTPLSPPPAPTVPDGGRSAYMPDATKLAALGLEDRGPRSDYHIWGCSTCVLYLFPRQQTVRIYALRETMLFVCPSEAFFDQLLIAVGWRPAP